MSRLLLLLAAGLAAEGCANRPREMMMKLELETTTTQQNGETHVEALLRNTGTEPVTVLLEPQLHHPSARLIDDQGRVLESRDNRAMQGRRAYSRPPKTLVLKPDDKVHIEGFQLLPAVKRAMAGPQSWELENVRSRTLTLEMSYEVSDGAAEETKLLKGPDVAVGTWTSKPVTLPYTK